MIVKATEPVNNGDGIGYFDEGGNYIGFRVNRVDGSALYPAPGSKVPARAGVTLYRNADVEHEARMERKDSSIRSIALTMTLRRSADHRIVLDVADERGNSISVATENTYSDTARTPQKGNAVRYSNVSATRYICLKTLTIDLVMCLSRRKISQPCAEVQSVCSTMPGVCAMTVITEKKIAARSRCVELRGNFLP